MAKSIFNYIAVKKRMKELGVTQQDLANFLSDNGILTSVDVVKFWFRKDDERRVSPELPKISLIGDLLKMDANQMLLGFDNIKTPLKNEVLQIPVFDMVAGFGTEGVLDPSFKATQKIKLPHEFLGSIDERYVRLIRCLGDSMSPEFLDGDFMLIEMLENRAFIKRAGIYLVRLNDIVYIKRVEFLPNNDIKLISINPAYPPFTASSTGYEWEILASVYGKISVKIGSGFQFDSQNI